MRMRYRTGVRATSDQACKVSHIGQKDRINAVRHSPERLKIDAPWIRGPAADDKFRLMFLRQDLDLIRDPDPEDPFLQELNIRSPR